MTQTTATYTFDVFSKLDGLGAHRGDRVPSTLDGPLDRPDAIVVSGDPIRLTVFPVICGRLIYRPTPHA